MTEYMLYRFTSQGIARTMAADKVQPRLVSREKLSVLCIANFFTAFMFFRPGNDRITVELWQVGPLNPTVGL